jgi:hypothetical protein
VDLAVLMKETRSLSLSELRRLREEEESSEGSRRRLIVGESGFWS